MKKVTVRADTPLKITRQKIHIYIFYIFPMFVEQSLEENTQFRFNFIKKKRRMLSSQSELIHNSHIGNNIQDFNHIISYNNAFLTLSTNVSPCGKEN